MFSSSKKVAPLLQGLDDHKEFSVIDVVVSFCWGESGRLISTGMEIPVGILLHEYSSHSSERCVGHDKEQFSGIQHLDYGGREECFLEFDKCVDLLFSPREGSPLFGQVMEWLSECREVRDKLLVEVAESDERSDSFY